MCESAAKANCFAKNMQSAIELIGLMIVCWVFRFRVSTGGTRNVVPKSKLNMSPTPSEQWNRPNSIHIRNGDNFTIHGMPTSWCSHWALCVQIYQRYSCVCSLSLHRYVHNLFVQYSVIMRQRRHRPDNSIDCWVNYRLSFFSNTHNTYTHDRAQTA